MSSFDREAEQEVDFGRYLRLLGSRWWLVAAGLVVGAVIGYAISLGGSQRFKATATLYLGQPDSASGNVQLQAAQTHPSTVGQIANAEKQIALINRALQSGLSSTDKLVLQLRLATLEDTKLSTSQLLLQAKEVEAPSVLTGAAAQRVTARSRRNTAVVAALIGLVLGAIAALMWDGLAAGFSRRRA